MVIITRIIRVGHVIGSQNRFLASNVHFYKMRSKTQPTEHAMRHYDSFYGKIYQKRWQSIRLGLLSPKKYAAIVNNYCDFDSIQADLRAEGAYNLRYIYTKNLKRIARHLEKKRWLAEQRLKAEAEALVGNHESGSIIQSNSPPPQIHESSESEFEEIGHFFTDSDAESSGTFVNAASMDLRLDEYVPASEYKYKEMEVVDEGKSYYTFYDLNSELDELNHIEQNILPMPELLNLYIYPRNNFSSFPTPKLQKTNLFNYYLIDAASALPVLALDIQDGDRVADLCAAPGGKSLLMLMMMKSGCRFWLNDVSISRFGRLKNVFDSFVPEKSRGNLVLSHLDASKPGSFTNEFDKILVDVPCTNDRHSLYTNENNIFSPKRVTERIAIPHQQLALLTRALHLVRPGGTVVYSTCSLSPIQNDGVVHQALKDLAGHFSVVDMKEALRPLRGVFEIITDEFRYGVQVVPHLPSNFGPIYFAKIVRHG